MVRLSHLWSLLVMLFSQAVATEERRRVAERSRPGSERVSVDIR
jgi:hypothetical protein